MADNEDAAAARAREQAIIRKERREAKIKAGGSARLDKIMGLNSGYKRDPLPSFGAPAEATTPSTTSKPTATPKPTAGEPSHADPDEVDISQHFYAPNTTSRPPQVTSSRADPSNVSEAQLRQMMLGLDRPGATPPPNPFGQPSGVDGPDAEDPMMKMLSQLMSGAGGGPGGNGGFPDLSSLPGFGGAGGGNPFANAQPAPVDRHAQIWRGVHFLVAILLGLYISLFTPFTGSLAAREQSAIEAKLNVNSVDEDAFKRYFFWAFGTAEALLLSTRYFLDGSREATQGGLIKMALGMVPAPWGGRIEVLTRYAGIFQGLRNDVLVCVFVMGVMAWARGGEVV